MNVFRFGPAARIGVAAALCALALAGCDTPQTSIGKKVDYKSVATAPALEVPPDLRSPQYDDRYNVSTASGLAARDATRPKSGDQIAPNQIADAKIVKEGNERWLHVRATPDQAWNITRQFWLDQGFVLSNELPGSGIMRGRRRPYVPGLLPAWSIPSTSAFRCRCEFGRRVPSPVVFFTSGASSRRRARTCCSRPSRAHARAIHASR